MAARVSPAFHHYPAFFYAGFWVRLLAYSVDRLVISSLTAISMQPLLAWFHVTTVHLFGFISLAAALDFLFYLVYFIAFTKLTNGQTLGKMIFGIQVVCFQEAELSWQTVFVRELSSKTLLWYPLSALIFVFTAFQRQKQSPIDLLCDTSVVTLNLVAAAQSRTPS